MKDAQCQQIVAGIERLEEYLQESIVKEALDLDSNHDTIQNQEFLLRLKRSLLQYTERGKNLVYIGFMGHFSAGKSSTINSLLALDEDSGQSRRVGLNPVDTSITLITHSENRDLIFNSTKEGLIPIRASYVDHEILRNIVIADTPGAGDPGLAKEMAKDFLPICDLIIYFLSAAIPLDNADVPLLQEKYSQLAFIPMKFAITRADEFKQTSELSFNDENFDRVKADAFLSELTQRLNRLFNDEISYIDRENIVLIDNKSGFRLEQFRNIILDFANISNPSSQISIHSHKIIYFKSSAEKLKSFFRSFLLQKLDALLNIIKTSQANIERFRSKIRVGNNALTESWNKKFSLIGSTRLNTCNMLPPLSETPDSVRAIYSSYTMREWDNQLKQQVDERFKTAKNIINRNCVHQLKKDKNTKRKEVNNLLSLDRLNSCESLELKFSPLIPEKVFTEVDFLPSSSLSYDAQKLIEDAFNTIEGYQKKLKTAINVLHSLLEEQRPLGDYRSCLSLANEDLSKDFDTYFENINIYRSGVFSLNSKQAISRLGLGAQLDKLESENLTDDEKLTIKQNAQEHIFPDSDRVFVAPSKSLSELKARLEALDQKTKSMNLLKSTTTSHAEMVEDFKSEKLAVIKDDFFRGIESALSQLQQGINIKVKELIVRFSDSWSDEVTAMKEERKKRLIIFLLSFSILSLIIYLLFVYGTQKEYSNNALTIIIAGVAVNIMSSIIGGVFAKVTDKFPIRIKAKESSILENFRGEYIQLIDESIDSFENSISLNSQDFYRFWRDILTTKPLNMWAENQDAFFEKLKSCMDEYSMIRQEYLEIVDDVTELSSNYFSDIDRNLKNLNEFSDDLQAKSIAPSFDLLESTKNNLETVIQNIQEIDFA